MTIIHIKDKIHYIYLSNHLDLGLNLRYTSCFCSNLIYCMSTPIFCLMGPTASGKTALACELLGRFPFEIISVDSAMIYRGMDIGTAKPTSEELALYPHHLIDIRDPIESFSVAEFCEEANTLCEDIISRGKIPFLVGGTMMYFNALQQGLAALPKADESLRASLTQEAQARGWEHMHASLAVIDPLSARKIHPHDSQRIQRALEVYYVSGKPMSILLQDEKTNLAYTYVNLILFPEDRSWLHARIATRFETMLRLGFLEEVQGLLQQWPGVVSCPAMRSVGYRQACEYLLDEGQNKDYASFCYKGLVATRQLAKRQLTWLRQWPNGHRYACDRQANLADILANTIHHYIITKERS